MRFTKTKKRWGLGLSLLVLVAILAFYPVPFQEPIHYVERESGLVKTEKVAAEKWLVWLYNNPLGEASLWVLAKRKLLSSVYGLMMDRSSSTEKIQAFVEDFDIDMNSVQSKAFSSFNDFFTRKLKPNARPVNPDVRLAVSPADGKVLAYADISNTDFIVKGYRFDVFTFLNDAELAQKYRDGTLVIIRLAPPDYHRFHFPLSGKIAATSLIDGDYYSVNPLALRKKAEIFCLNKREFTILSNPLFGDVVLAEVGATMVGSIEQTYTGDFVQKGEEKGYFKFGGSTVILLFEKGKIHLDEDLLNNSAKGYETAIKQGERMGKALHVSAEF